MRHSILPLAIITLVSLMAGCASAPSSATQKPAALPAAAGATVRNAPGIGLEKGMSADAVRQLLGKPSETKLLVTSEGMAEVWTYHRIVDKRINQIQTGSKPVPYFKGNTSYSADGNTSDTTIVQEPVYGQEFIETDEATMLLMFNGKLLEWKQSREERRKIY